MSERLGTLHSQLRTGGRWPYYAAAALLAVLALAYIDGGEEPLHMIEHRVAVPDASGEGQ